MYRNFILQSLLIYLSTCDFLGGGGIVEIAVSPLPEWGEKYNSGKTGPHILYEGVCVLWYKGQAWT